MNPGIILILLFVFGNQSKRKGKALPAMKMHNKPFRTGYIDTFKMELLLDRLHNITGALQKINLISQAQKVPTQQGSSPSIERVQDSLDAIKGFLADGKASRQVDTISNTLSDAKKLGDLEELMSTMGPIISKLIG